MRNVLADTGFSVLSAAYAVFLFASASPGNSVYSGKAFNSHDLYMAGRICSDICRSGYFACTFYEEAKAVLDSGGG